ncbi:MAG: DNA repair protein RecN [Bacteroidetes bacterium]|nr:DNA repair protein RecN [Bacteroidota bacterium]
MLHSLEIKDYALIENIHIEFMGGLNIITGETGAGKSILIDAMSLLLGERASTLVVRKEANKSIIEGIFDIKGNNKVAKLLTENDIEVFDDLIIRREISVKGSNRCFINDTPVQLSLIQSVGNQLVDLHGQHDHQSLLKINTHLELIDDFGELDVLKNEYKKHYTRISEITKELFSLRSKEEKLGQDKESYEFQLKEINAVSPRIGEEEELKEQLNLLENSENILSLSNEIYCVAYDNESSAHDQLVEISHLLEKLKNIDLKFGEKLSELLSAIEIIGDIAKFVRTYSDKIDLESGTLDEMRERLGALSLLKKRYGGSVEKIIEHRTKLIEELEIVVNYDERIKKFEKELESERFAAGQVASDLSEIRKKVAKNIEREVVGALKELGINDATFRVDFKINKLAESAANYVLIGKEKYKFNASGVDEVEFLVSTNLGEDPKPLAKIASGGEISRIMLALKSILAKSDRLPLLIFDEIDTGVSGRIAQKVGNTLKELSKFHQIISITHLPQIAGYADTHFAVEKIKLGSRVVSSIKKLDEHERVREVAKLLSGEEITEASLKSARELIEFK